jgi:hypothetical protein
VRYYQPSLIHDIFAKLEPPHLSLQHRQDNVVQRRLAFARLPLQPFVQLIGDVLYLEPSHRIPT